MYTNLRGEGKGRGVRGDRGRRGTQRRTRVNERTRDRLPSGVRHSLIYHNTNAYLSISMSISIHIHKAYHMIAMTYAGAVAGLTMRGPTVKSTE
jgi:hypothetical protein